MIHLHTHTPYSFLDGATHIEEMVRAAAESGMGALAMTDHNSVAGAVKFREACRGYAVRPLYGAEMTMEDLTHLTLLAKNRTGYANICRLITRAHAQGGRLSPRLAWADLEPHAEGLFCLSGCRKGRIASLTHDHRYAEAEEAARGLRDCFGESFRIELQDDLTPDSRRVARDLAELSDRLCVEAVATNNVHYARPEDAGAHEILRCISTLTTVDSAHHDRPLNAERYLKSAAEMAGIFHWRPDAVEATGRIAEMCEDALPAPEDVTPSYPIPGAHADAAAYLRHLTYKGAKARYRTLTDRVTARLEHELAIIVRLGFADYFLLAWEVTRWSRAQKIRVTGRGSAADSCVAYSLFLTDVDVISRNLPFARFLTEAKLPDIDLDFPSSRRDEVFRHIIDRYGADHAGMVCVFHTYRAKGALRDAGKALGLPQDLLSWFSDHVSGFTRADQLEEAFGRHAELKPHVHLLDRFKTLFSICARLAEMPRHIGTHSSGIVISRVPLSTIAPIVPSARGLTQIWTLDKDDAETLRAIKLDVLALRMLSAVEDTEADIARLEGGRSVGDLEGGRSVGGLEGGRSVGDLEGGRSVGALEGGRSVGDLEGVRSVGAPPPRHAIGSEETTYVPIRRGADGADALRGKPRFSYDRIPIADEDTFRMLRASAAVGTFQLESSAQLALAATLQPDCFEDLVSAVALIRPGPVRANTVSRFVSCRNGYADASFLHPCLVPMLAKSFGTILYQEQAIQVIAAMTGCSEAEADIVRKSLAKHARRNTMDQVRAQFVRDSMTRHPDFTEDRANALFDMLEGWSGYGFTEGHAASFGLTAYRTAYLSVHHPAEFFASQLNHQPMGFYSANTLAAEARRRGVTIRPLDINRSFDKSYAEETEAIRVGLRLVTGIKVTDITQIEEARKERPYLSLIDFCSRVTLHRDLLENLILSGAFDSLHPNRRGILWGLDETLAMARTYGVREHTPASSTAPGTLFEKNELDDTLEGDRSVGALEGDRSVGALEGDRSVGALEGDRSVGAPPPRHAIGSEETAYIPTRRGADGAAALHARGADGPDALQSSSTHTHTPTQTALNLGTITYARTPEVDIEDFSPWDSFMWTWRLTGVCADCHPFAYLRDRLSAKGIITADEANKVKPGTRVTVAGINIRPHRPPTRSGKPVLFSTAEDETGMVALICVNEVIDLCTPVFLLAPAVIVRGVIERKGKGASLKVEKAKPLRLQDFVTEADAGQRMLTAPPPVRTYTGTRLREPAAVGAG